MALKEQLQADLNASLRARDVARASAIRMLRSAIQYEEKARGHLLDDQGVVEVVSRQVKERRESIAAFEAGGRQDLVAKEKAELAILELYLPEQLTPQQLEDVVRQVVAEVGATTARDKGKVMGRLMPQIRGKADGALANELVTRLLAGDP